MKRFKVKKLEILGYPISISKEVLQKEVIKSSRLFVKLTKTTPRSLDDMYTMAKKFVNLERELE